MTDYELIEEEFAEVREKRTGRLGQDLIRLSSDKPHNNELFTVFYDVDEQQVITCGVPQESDLGPEGNGADGSSLLIVKGDFPGNSTTIWAINDIIPKKKFIAMAKKLEEGEYLVN